MRSTLRLFILPTNLFVLVLLVATSCKKTETPDPDLANKVMGTYKVTMVSMAGSGQPVPVTGGMATLIRSGLSLEKVDLTLSYATASTSGSSNFSETKSISLQASGAAILLFDGTTQVGSWVSNTITFANYPFNNTTLAFTATK